MKETDELIIKKLDVACRLATTPVGSGVKDLTTFDKVLSDFQRAYKAVSEVVTENDPPQSESDNVARVKNW